MNTSPPLFKVRADRFEVRQGQSYVSIDRGRIDGVHYHSGVLSVRYIRKGEITLDCVKVNIDDLESLVRVLQTQRDQNQKKELLAQKRRDASSILPGLFG